MKIKRALVVYKKSAYRVYARERKDPQFLSLVKKGHAVAKRFRSSHLAHETTMKRVREILKRENISAKYVYRAGKVNESGFDLVITVGGDGTFLDASHQVSRCPILGVNSSPKDSVGMFCGATSQNLEEVLERIRQDRVRIFKLSRVRVRLNQRLLPPPVLNDVLIAHPSPAGTSRYILGWKKRNEEQKSSGIWVSPAAGSTGAIRGAGGRSLPLESDRIQFVVREPYHAPGERLRCSRGIFSKKEKLVMVSKMRVGKVFIDGSHLAFPFPLGSRIEIFADSAPLKVIAMDKKRRDLL